MFDKFIEWLDRAKSRVYGIYVFWLLLTLSPIIFCFIFVDQGLIYEKTGLLKNEYIRTTFFDFTNRFNWVYCFAIIVMPIILTRLTIWEFPKWFVNAAYEKESEHQMTREILNIQNQNKIENEKTKLIKEKTESTKALVEFVDEKKKLEIKEEEKWQIEYLNFKDSKHYVNFHLIPQAIYQYYGNTIIKDNYTEEIEFEIPIDLLAYADGVGLIEVDIKNQKISLTDKGRYFITQYQLDTAK